MKTSIGNILSTLTLVGLCLITSACVTETTGGLPPPAPQASRVEAQLDLARGYLEQGDLNRAKAPLEKALQIDPNHVEAHVLNALLFHAQNEYELAEYHYKKALRIEPGNAQALNNYGTFLYARGRFEDAVVPLSKLVKDTSYRARPQAFENLGLAKLRAGDEEGAEAAFTRALELNFRLPRSTLELAEIAYARGDYADASARLLEFKTMSRQNARSLCLSLKTAQAVGDTDTAASQEMALKNLFPEQAEQCRVRS